jgi:hypothetical protein
MDEVHTTIGLVLQLGQDRRVENEQGHHVAMILQRAEETVVVLQTKVTPEPMDAYTWFHGLGY